MPYHHYVSAFHLAWFTLNPHRGRRARIHVLDLQDRRQYPTRVGGAGGEGAYNAVHGVEGLAPEAMEQMFERRYESPAAPALRAVNETLELPSPEELGTLLNYFAFLFVNNPARRGAMNDSQERALYFMAQWMLAHPEVFEATQAQFRREGVPLLSDVSFEELRAMVEGGSFTYRMPTVAHLRGMGTVVDFLADMLRQRAWSLLVPPPAGPAFVCGDRPVMLSWTTARRQELLAAGALGAPPGFALPGTEVIVPLGRRAALLGAIGGESRTIPLGELSAAEINGRAVRRATRFVYSGEPAFALLDRQGVVRNSAELIAGA